MKESFLDLTSLIHRFRPPAAPIVVAFAAALLETGAALWTPMLIANLLDGFQVNGLQRGTLILLISLLLVGAFAGALSHYYLGYAGQRVVVRLRAALYDALLKLPVSFFHQNGPGALASRVVNDTTAIRKLATEELVYLVSSLIMVLGSVVVMWFLDWKMTLILFGCVAAALLIILPIALKLEKIAADLQDETAVFTGDLTRVFGDVKLMKASGAEEHERGRGEASMEKLFHLHLRETRIQAVMSPLMSMAMTGALVAILGYGGARAATGQLAVGELTAFVLYLFHIITPMVQIGFFFSAFNAAMGAAGHVASLFKQESENPEGLPVPDGGETVVFKNVDFSYGPDEKEALRDVNLHFEANAVTALVGPSGAGKSTIFSLLERFHRPDRGEIFLGDQPVSDLELKSYRQLLGYVPQDAPIMAGSVRDNICYGLEGPVDDEDVRNAARMAYAHEFIEAMPQGYETQVGDRGARLSGGQRQRVAIARALLRNPRILLLDEATSSLDSESEYMVQKALSNLKRDRTTLVIAHRLSTVMDAHAIVVLDEGKVAAVGNHRSLFEDSPLYRNFVERQTHTPEEALEDHDLEGVKAISH